MKKIITCILIIFIFFGVSCKKDKDTISNQSIHGQVFNLCTDSGLVNCTVFLKENGNTVAQMQSGANGNFTFNSVLIHSSNSYTYAIATIDNPDGGHGEPPISGDAIALDKGNLTKIYKLQVVPLVLQWFLYFPKGTTTNIHTDTVSLTIQQKIFHKNFPSGNYLMPLWSTPTTYTPSSSLPANYIGDFSFEWMGWWYSTLSKTKNGISTVKTDSFYVGWNVNVTDTIPW